MASGEQRQAGEEPALEEYPMTQLEAEGIWMANQAGVFHGKASELANAVLLLSKPEIEEPVGEFWLCAGRCGQWRKGLPAGHNGSGPVCESCERDARAVADYETRDHQDNWRGD